MEVAHTHSVDEIYKAYHVSPTSGLDKKQVDEARKKHGYNGKI